MNMEAARQCHRFEVSSSSGDMEVGTRPPVLESKVGSGTFSRCVPQSTASDDTSQLSPSCFYPGCQGALITSSLNAVMQVGEVDSACQR